MKSPFSFRALPRAWALCGALALAGCSTPALVAPIGSNRLSGQFLNQPEATPPLGVDAEWWRGFGDPVLSTLVDRGQAANHDLRLALARLQAARAGVDAQASRLMPSLNLQAAASRSASGLPAAVKQAGQPDVRAYSGSLNASWEIDWGGGLQAAHGAAKADAASAEAGVAGARLLVAADIARLYFELRGVQERLRVVQALAQTQADTARAVARRAAEGEASRFDVERARAEAESIDAQLPALHTALVATRNRLAVLMGDDPSAAPDLTGPVYQWPAPREIGSGQPSDLLRRRPDLMAAELRLAAESLRSTEARAQTWPKLFVSALFGREDLRLNALDLAPVRFSSVAAAFALPLFDGGRIQAGIAAQGARETEALVAWQKAALIAVEDVENSLAARTDEGRRAALLEAAVAARRQALRHAESLRREGQIDLLTLLDVQRSLLASELALVDGATQRALADVQLFKALGGGWQPPPALLPVYGPSPVSTLSRTLP